MTGWTSVHGINKTQHQYLLAVPLILSYRLNGKENETECEFPHLQLYRESQLGDPTCA